MMVVTGPDPYRQLSASRADAADNPPESGVTPANFLPGGRLCAARQVASHKVGAPEGGSISCARDRSLTELRQFEG